MPITIDRLYDLLHEHEQCLSQLRDLERQLRDLQAGGIEPTGFEVLALTLAVISKLPDKFALIERRQYNATFRRNERNKEKMRLRRRQEGIPERLPPASPAEERLRARAPTRTWDGPTPEEVEMALKDFVPKFEEVKGPEEIAQDDQSLIEGL